MCQRFQLARRLKSFRNFRVGSQTKPLVNVDGKEEFKSLQIQTTVWLVLLENDLFSIGLKLSALRSLPVQIPQTQCLIPWSRQSKLSIWRDDNIRDKVTMTWQCPLWLTVIGVLILVHFPNQNSVIWKKEDRWCKKMRCLTVPSVVDSNLTNWVGTICPSIVKCDLLLIWVSDPAHVGRSENKSA